MARSDNAALDALDAAAERANPIAGLWQMPLLLLSLGLFTLAAYLFIDPSGGPGVAEQLERARRDVRGERYDAAVGRMNDLLAAGVEGQDQAAARLIVAEALDLGMRRSRREETPAAHRRILREVAEAKEAGATDSPELADRSARSWEALGNVDRASAEWRRAARMLDELKRPAEGVPMRRSSVEMLVAHDQPAAAAEELRDMLDVPGLADDERAWALGELARIAVDAGRPDEAMPLLAEALGLSPDEAIRGQVNFRLGYAAFKLGDSSGAEGYLTLARGQLGTGHTLDAEACYLLGQIERDRIGNGSADDDAAAAKRAAAFYDVVLRDHPGSRVAPKARIGRAVARLVLGDADGGVTDLVTAAQEVASRPGSAPLKDDLIEALRRGERVLSARDRHEQALELMAHEQRVAGDPAALPAVYFARLGQALEARGDQVMADADDAEEEDRLTVEKQARQLWVRAGDAFVAYSRRLTLSDDEAYGDALWRGIGLYERAGDLREMIAALATFTRERPEDPIAPDAMLALGRAYQAVGAQDRAVETFVNLQGRHPQSLAAAEAAVPLAQVYLAQGRDRWPLAENVLRGTVENNPVLTPDSRVFRAATYELGKLYHAAGRWGEALAKFEEYADRYDDPERRGRLLFLRADCYRQAAAALAAQADAATVDARVAATVEADPAPDRAAAEEARRLRRRHLAEAKRLFEAAVAAYGQAGPGDEVDRTYERLAWFYRADCLYDLGRYDEAIDLYDAAAFRYQDDPSSLSAYVQIVNSHVAMGRTEQARVANERAKWLLRRIPPESFQDGRLALGREQWEQWLEWSGESGLW